MPYLVYSLWLIVNRKKTIYYLPSTIYQSGFTLIELLISISIIATVFGIIITSAGQIQKTARDEQRKADLVNLQSLLQRYYADQNFYPNNNFKLGTDTDLTDKDGNPNITGSPTKTYSTTMPKESLSSGPAYCYIAYKLDGTSTDCDNSSTNPNPEDKCQKYEIFAYIEGDTTSPPPYSCGTGTNKYNYKVSAN